LNPWERRPFPPLDLGAVDFDSIRWLVLDLVPFSVLARAGRGARFRSSKSSGSSQMPSHGGTAALQASSAADQGGALKHRFGQLSFTPAQCSTNCCTGGQLQGARQSDPGEGAGLHGKVSTRTQTQLPSSARFACMLAVLTFDWFFQMSNVAFMIQ